MWIDKNEDGIQNNQSRIKWVLVKLFDEVGTLIRFDICSHFDRIKFRWILYFLILSILVTIMFNSPLLIILNFQINTFDARCRIPMRMQLVLTTVFSLPPSTQLDSIDMGYIILAPVIINIEGVVWKDVNNNLVKRSIQNPY